MTKPWISGSLFSLCCFSSMRFVLKERRLRAKYPVHPFYQASNASPAFDGTGRAVSLMSRFRYRDGSRASPLLQEDRKPFCRSGASRERSSPAGMTWLNGEIRSYRQNKASLHERGYSRIVDRDHTVNGSRASPHLQGGRKSFCGNIIRRVQRLRPFIENSYRRMSGPEEGASCTFSRNVTRSVRSIKRSVEDLVP